nr:immunoglobulin light chain junction region [Macaca mulatta]MOX11690.1 immunoglobulin light chain junction region [Macaca mulatta]MOX12587.1 immunoglobulin light chain junction region [Macaca mulatta]MOX12599.1 immunoglobulin light chain junction region [Macaca mulatta]MOX13394.1 immunoglobulin light chain junction region [Macaca mulatta]
DYYCQSYDRNLNGQLF